MPTTQSILTKDEQDKLVAHALKHKNYPYKFKWNRTINNTNFATVDGGTMGRYLTRTFTTKQITPVVGIAASVIVTPNTTVGMFSIVASYKSTLSYADFLAAGVPDDEGGDIYQLLTNGGAINDFQVFYPLNWYMDRNSPMYIHVFADTATCSAGTSTSVGQVILLTLPTGA